MAEKKKFRMNLRVKLTIILIILSISPMILISNLTYQKSVIFFKENIVDSLESIVYLKSQAIDAFVNDRIHQVEGIATMPEIVLSAGQIVDFITIAETQKIKPEKSKIQPQSARKETAPNTGLQPRKIENETTEKVPELLTEDIIKEPAAPQEGVSEEHATFQADQVSEQKNLQEQASYQIVNKVLSLILAQGEKFEELFILDPSGTVRISTHYEHEGKSAAHNPYFANATKATFIQDIYVSGLTGKLSMVIATPIKDEIGKVIGILGARLNLGTFHQLIKTEKGLGKTGETVVGKKIDDEIVFMAPTRYDDEAALKRKIVTSSKIGLPLQEAARGREGSGFTVDYRGTESLAAWGYIPTLKWGLVAKMDAREALEPVNNVKHIIAVVTLGLIAAAIVLAIIFSKGIVSPLQELTQAANDISRGNLDVKFNIKSRDEVGDLAESFERMVAAIRFLKEESADSTDEKADERG